MTEAALVEGQVKLRDGKKWRSRWLVLRKPSPVAGAGVFFLSSAEGEQISFLFDCIVRGISPTKGPFGLRPVLPDLSPGGPAVEERVAQEALETLQLEKRLSLLSHSGWPGSAGDDRSLSSSSSEASHSDVSASSRLAPWPEPSPSSAGASPEGLGLAAAQAPGEAAAGASRPPPRPLRPRQLQEVGRQSSSDSGIATGSHSSYSGSFSSFVGSSLDVWRGADELGSLLSLPGGGAPERSLCACAPGAAEYQVPAAPRPHYDTPRSLRQAARDQTPATQGSASDGAAGDSGGRPSAGCPSGWLGERRRGQATEAPSGPGEPWEAGAPHAGPPPALFSACPVCGGLKGPQALPVGRLRASCFFHALRGRPARLHGFWLRGLVCPFALRFQTPLWKARPVSVRSGLRPAASRTQLTC
ncbi:protein Dok-7 isoform 6-T6 [Megaptera novaeangliae]